MRFAQGGYRAAVGGVVLGVFVTPRDAAAAYARRMLPLLPHPSATAPAQRRVSGVPLDDAPRRPHGQSKGTVRATPLQPERQPKLQPVLRLQPDAHRLQPWRLIRARAHAHATRHLRMPLHAQVRAALRVASEDTEEEGVVTRVSLELCAAGPAPYEGDYVRGAARASREAREAREAERAAREGGESIEEASAREAREAREVREARWSVSPAFIKLIDFRKQKSRPRSRLVGMPHASSLVRRVTCTVVSVV